MRLPTSGNGRAARHQPTGRDHVVVVGGSLSGLLSAQVLAARFARVTVVERDLLAPDTGFRRGAPQAHHVHLLLERGALAMESILPGLRAELAAGGAPGFDFGEAVRILLSSGWTPLAATGVTTQAFSRPFLEQRIRSRVLTLPNLTLTTGFHVDDLLWAGDGETVCGVSGRRDGRPARITADLVVDASGQASRFPQWLASAGLPALGERTIDSGISYTSRRYLGHPQTGPLVQGNYCSAPDRRSGGAYSVVEGDQCIVTLFGIGSDGCPTGAQEYADFTHRLPQHAVADYIDTHTPVGPIHRFVDLRNRWRLTHRYRRWPRGFTTIGDAVCVFNPVYAQGMTVAALQALELGVFLDRGESTRAFQRRAARTIRTPWIMATNSDLAWQSGPIPLPARLASRYLDLITARIPGDPGLYQRFVRVQHMRSSPALLVAPATLRRLLRRPPSTASRRSGPT